MLKKGNLFPDFKLKIQDGTLTTVKDLKGHWSVVYFYMKNYSDICTKLATQFSALARKFKIRNTLIYGVSRETERSNFNMHNEHKLAQFLLSDPDHVLIEAVGIWGPKMLHGKQAIGLHRTTFILDPDARVQQVFPAVNPHHNHPSSVLEALLILQDKEPSHQ
ncbi:MAG: redoxin domain-containing protein [Deltaproteobacteria bacterium]|jgi:peroxiredoxin Q/BCP|nr:redoxin domain-containing protein [Deltaproteobacteria bacterium]